jgi:hypothetical protein
MEGIQSIVDFIPAERGRAYGLIVDNLGGEPE